MEPPELPFPPAMGSYRLTASFLYFFLGPVLCAFSGFHTASYLLVGLYTWPRTSRVIVLTIGMLIFSYEFIYKNHKSRPTNNWRPSSLESVFYTCVIPYTIGVGALLVLAGLSE
ncbi:MAG: hypothetical protein OEY80_02725 [Nitrospirota bacterium]|nr:hypothetical protein [Nitrospirota bacterium]